MRGKKHKNPESYVERTYRERISGDGLVSSLVKIQETDLHILADRDVTGLATGLVLKYRLQLESCIARDDRFLSSLAPLADDELAVPLVREMLKAGIVASVGPMAAVAGAIAEYVGRDLLASGCKEVFVENGGDIFLSRRQDCTVAIFAGESPLSMKVGLRLAAAKMPLGVCTSSGTVGHSLSFGRADSVTVIAGNTAIADAVATRLGNEVGAGRNYEAGIKRALEVGRGIGEVSGIVVIRRDRIGAVGDVELVSLA